MYIGADFDHGYRAARITELLAASEDLAVEDMAAIHMDEYDASAAAVVPHLLDLEVDDPAVRAMQETLRPWAESSDPYQMDASSAGAAAYAALWRHLLAHTFDELPDDRPADGSSRYFAVVERLLEDPENVWWDKRSTAAVESVDDILVEAARSAHEELADILGDDPESWEASCTSPRSRTRLRPVGDRPDRSVVQPNRDRSRRRLDVNATGWAAQRGYEVAAVPSMRMVVDLADFSRSTAIHTTGQSGHAFHRHYFDMAEEWAQGKTRSFPFEPPAEGDVLRLVPRQSP